MAYGRSNKKTVKKTTARKYGKKSYKKGGTTPKVSMSVQKYVKRILHKEIENKSPTPISGQDVSIVPITNTISWGTLIGLSDVWQIPQGVGQGNRLGDKLKPTKWYLRGFIHNNSATAVPAVVKMFVFRQKMTYESPAGAAFTGPVDFFQYGSSTVGPANNYQDLLREVNKDKYILYTTRSFKIAPAGSAGNTNNDFSTVGKFKVDLIKYAKRVLTYNDAVNTPLNSGLYVCFALAEYGGTTKTVWAAGEAPQISYDIIAEYEDA